MVQELTNFTVNFSAYRLNRLAKSDFSVEVTYLRGHKPFADSSSGQLNG